MMMTPKKNLTAMAKPERPPILLSVGGTRIQPIMFALPDTTRAIERPSLNCPTCSARMRLVRRAPTIGAPAALVATCARCAGRSDA